MNEHPFIFPQLTGNCKGALTGGQGASKMGTMAASVAQWVNVFKALGHPVRLRIVALLAEGEACVCQLATVLGLAFSTVSSHLSELRRAGLVAERKEGRWAYYSLTGKQLEENLLRRFLLPSLAVDPQVRQDLAFLRQVQELPLSDVARQAAKRGTQTILPLANRS